MSRDEAARSGGGDDAGGHPLVIAIFGPTASGKTSVAEALAERIPAELVSADSAQVYRGLPLLTNQSARPARLVAIWELEHEASVAEFQELAHAAVDEILATGKTPIVVGGTGLYFRAAIGCLDIPPQAPPSARQHWERVYDGLGSEEAHRLLAERDAAAGAAVHPNDRRRVVRGLELAEAGASLRRTTDRLWAADTRLPTLVVGLEVPRETLVARIEQRTRRMFEAGVVEEVKRALGSPLSSTARHVMGLHEVATLPREDAEAAIAQRTRRLAAYQRKWMRRIPGLVSVRADRLPDEVADEILALARARERVPAGRAGDPADR